MKTETQGLATVTPLASRHRPGTRMHREKVITGQLVPFPAKLSKQAGPVIGRDATALLPLLSPGSRHIKIGSHFRELAPRVENVFKSSHAREFAPDELSGQGPTMIPMTTLVPLRTIGAMGRASTPAKFRSEMAKRLMSARIVAGYATKREAAEKLGITLDRYEKWESGRTPVPAQYVGPVCALFNIDANYLFGVEPSPPARKTG